MIRRVPNDSSESNVQAKRMRSAALVRIAWQHSPYNCMLGARNALLLRRSTRSPLRLQIE